MPAGGDDGPGHIAYASFAAITTLFTATCIASAYALKRAAKDFNEQQLGLLAAIEAIEREKKLQERTQTQQRREDGAGADNNNNATSGRSRRNRTAVSRDGSTRGGADYRNADRGAPGSRSRSMSGSWADVDEFGGSLSARSPRATPAATPTKSTRPSTRNARIRDIVDAHGGADSSDADDRDVSLGTPKKRATTAIQAPDWEDSGREAETEMETETETDADQDEERTRVEMVESPSARRTIQVATPRVDGVADSFAEPSRGDLEELIGSPLPKALSTNLEMEMEMNRTPVAIANAADGARDADLMSTPSGSSLTPAGEPTTPFTATPDSRTAVGLKPADRSLGRELLQRMGSGSMGGNAHVGAMFASPRITSAGDSSLQYEKINTEMMETLGHECEEVCLMLEYALSLRDKWLFDDSKSACPIVGFPDKIPDTLPPKSNHTFEMVDGVVHVYHPNASGKSELIHQPPGTATQFFHDLHALLRVQSYGPSKTFCHKRLLLTEQKFNLHCMLNADREFQEQKTAPHRDFYNVRKVDTHVHHSACMNQKHLLRFIKSKLKREPHELVIYRDGKFLNLREVFESIGMTAYELNVDTLDMHADKNTFHRFDKFNLKYNPMGQSRLREIFIKQDNLIRGRFLAELTKQVCSDLEANKYTMAEYRISIYGRKPSEWDNLAAWVLNHSVFSENIVWMIQIPRLYNVYHSNGTMKNFQQMLDNIFVPLFEVTVDPSSHPKLHTFLQMVVGIDMVDDESKPERRPSKHMRVPSAWDVKHNPAYAYYAYYVYANLYTLNALRASKGLNSIAFRPHAGEAGDIDHLCATFMLAKNIAHGLNLRKSPCLQYLYYLAQIPMDMSPLSNNSLFIDYHKNPFPIFFARGLPVTLSTDDPLMIHMTKEPLVEEYSVAAQVWKLSAADLCEIAKTSVLNSGFPRASKRHWVSDHYWLTGTRGNDIQKTNVPNLRAHFREEVLETERSLVRRGVVQARAKGREIRVYG